MLKRRICIAIYCACFAQGTVAHILDFINEGWLPYHRGPLLIRVFWTFLVLLDPGVIVLLLKHRRAGLVAAGSIMLLDVIANSYAAFILRDNGFAIALPLQCLFVGFILGSFPFLWPVRHLQ